MACSEEIRLLLSSYVDGETSPEESVRACAHLERCVECRELVEEWGKGRELFEWAFRRQFPEAEPASMGEILPGSEKMQEQSMKLPRKRVWTWNWSWGTAWKLAAAVFIGLLIFHFATLPPMLEKHLTTTTITKSARMENGITLMVAPNSQITRLGANRIRLDKGWVRAAVRHGSREFIIQTKRLQIRDLGTRFEVGTLAKRDVVFVDEGVVSVTQEHWTQDVGTREILVSTGASKPSIIKVPPIPEKRSDDEGSPFFQPGSASDLLPANEEELARQLNLEQITARYKLSERFHDLRGTGSSWSGTTGDSRAQAAYWFTPAPRVRYWVAKHFRDIARGAFDAPLQNANWEFTIGYLQIGPLLADDIASGSKSLPRDFYYVRMMAENGRLFWKLDGTYGQEARVPVTLGDLQHYTTGCSGEGLNMDFKQPPTMALHRGYAQFTLRFLEWPGELQPLMVLEAQKMPLSESRTDKILKGLKAAMPEVAGLSPEWKYSHLFFLDTKFQHWTVQTFDKRFFGLLTPSGKSLRPEAHGAAWVGVIGSDMPFAEPQLPAGVYLLRLVQPTPKDAFTFQVLDSTGRQVLANLPYASKTRANRTYSAESSDYPGSLDAHLWMGIETRGNSYAFSLKPQVWNQGSVPEGCWSYRVTAPY